MPMRSPNSKKHRAVLTAIITITVAALAFASCNRKVIYTHYTHTPIEGWNSGDTLLYVVDPVAEPAHYTETIGLRICNRYPFKALTLIVDQRLMPAGTLLSDTLRCRLTDEEGQPLARGFNFFESSFPLRTVSLQAGDTLVVRLRHYMKREILPGIADIGLTVRRE